MFIPTTALRSPASVRGWYYPEMNGAVRDGITNDTVAVQETLDSASANGYGVFFSGGTYLVDPLTVPTQVVLQGLNGFSYLTNRGAPISRLLLSGSATGPLLSPDDTPVVSTGVHINDLMLDTNNRPQSSVYLADAGASIGRFWEMQRCLSVNSGFSSSAHGSAIYVGVFNTGCIVDTCQVLSNADGVVTQHNAGWDGIGWYGSDGFLLNTFIGCFGQSGIDVYGGDNDITLQIQGGGSFWNDYGLLIGGYGAVILGFSIDHNYNDGIYASKGFSAFGCNFHSNSLQTNNTWSHITVGAAVAASIYGCRLSIRAGDAPANDAKYFINAASGAIINAGGNNQNPSATLGTGWSNYDGVITAPSFPASTVAAINTTGADVQAFIANSTSAITAITLGTTVTGMTIPISGTAVIRVPKGQSIKFTYAGGTPTWTWVAG